MSAPDHLVTVDATSGDDADDNKDEGDVLQTSHATVSEERRELAGPRHLLASQGPLPLDKPDQLPPTFLQGRNGESAASNVQGQAPSLPAPSVEPQPLAWPHHDTGATQEPLRVSRGNLGNPWSSESGLLSLRQSSQGKWKESDTSLLSSGYAGDEENSEVSLVANTPNLRLPRRLHTQAGSAPSSQLCTIYSPSQIRSRVASQACGSRQAGEEKRGQPAQQQPQQQGQQPDQHELHQPGQHQASSCQDIPVDGNVQSGVKSNTSLQEDKSGGKAKAGDQAAKEEQPAQMCMPL
uniref:protein TNT n=1 Tax=Odobenus rosmarus divergens TaxID=9708 RepID=UPI00063C0889|nr:PREDICTED: protein TNT [Odobenus rosmarus divergens]